jgi:hypothetical protein
LDSPQRAAKAFHAKGQIEKVKTAVALCIRLEITEDRKGKFA